MGEIQIWIILPFTSIETENGLQNSQVSTSIVFHICLMMENNLMVTFNSLDAIKNDENLVKIGQKLHSNPTKSKKLQIWIFPV